MARRTIDIDWIRAVESRAQAGLLEEPHAPPRALDPDLMSTIEHAIIPRLVLAHARVEPAPCSEGRPPPTSDELGRFTSLIVRGDVAAVLGYVEALAREGVSIESVLLDLVAPAARQLGAKWLADELSFADVTVGLGALQRVVAVIGSDAPMPLDDESRSVLLVNCPGDQHTLGIHLCGELLRQAGWGVVVASGLDEAEVLDMVASEEVLVLGFSLNRRELAASLRRLITEAKRASRNPDLVIMVGGSEDLAPLLDSTGAIFCPTAAHALDWLEQNLRRGH